MKLLALVLVFVCHPLAAQEIRVLSGGAARAFLEPMARGYGAAKVTLEYQPMGRLVKALAEGAQPDMVVVTEEVLETLKARGRPIARVGIGVAVHEGAPSPDISSAEAFRRTLLAAKSVVYIDPKTGTSGKHVAFVLQKLNILEEVNRKATLAQGGYIVEPVGRGEIELGIHQISEILPVKGIKLVGPLPPELQKYTVYVAVNRRQSPAVEGLIAHLTGPHAREQLARAGYTPAE